MPETSPLFPILPQELNLDLERQNPWWQAKPLPVLPEFRRWPFLKLRERLDSPIAPIVVIRGPRQIGKTTLQLQLIQSLLDDGVDPKRILRVQFDELPALEHAGFLEPILRIVEWFEHAILRASVNESARQKPRSSCSSTRSRTFRTGTFSSSPWSIMRRRRVLVTGSSALRQTK